MTTVGTARALDLGGPASQLTLFSLSLPPTVDGDPAHHQPLPHGRAGKVSGSVRVCAGRERVPAPSLSLTHALHHPSHSPSLPSAASTSAATAADLAGATAQPLAVAGVADAAGAAAASTAAASTAASLAATLPLPPPAWVLRNPPVRETWRPGGAWSPGSFADPAGPRIAFVTTTAEPYAQIARWYEYHVSLGVSTFYLFVDGPAAAPAVAARLRALPGVLVIPRDSDLKARHAASRAWNETWLAAFFHKPCNHELFVLQSLNMEVGIALAERDAIDWILHIDTDELMYPGNGPEYSLQTVLAAYPPDVDTVVFPNYEALPERDDVTAPFDQVTLFKRNYQHVLSDAYFRSYHAVARGNPNYFITYGNGKSAARVRPGLRPNGAHRWYSYASPPPREETSPQSAVLHYTYNRFEDLKSRRDRCDCAPTDEDAKRCFILPFDRAAFLAASLKSDADLAAWFRERLVWNDPDTVTDLLKAGLFVRIFEPQLFMRGSVNGKSGEEKTGGGAAAAAAALSDKAAAASDAASTTSSLPIKDGSMLEERPLPRELGSAAVLKGIRDPGVGWNAVGLASKEKTGG